jgi:hypothetical protein
LIELSAKRRWMSYEELNTTLPDEMVDPEKLDELLVLCRRLEVEFIDEETVRRNRYETFQAPLQTNLKFKRDDPKKPEKKAKPAPVAQPVAAPAAEQSPEEKANAAAVAAAAPMLPVERAEPAGRVGPYAPTEKQVAFYQRLAESPVFSEEERRRALEWLATKATRQSIKDQIDWLKRQVETRKASRATESAA